MDSLLMNDEKYQIAAGIEIFLKKKRKLVSKPLKKNAHFYFVGDNFFLGDYLIGSLPLLRKNYPQFRSLYYVKNGAETKERLQRVKKSGAAVLEPSAFSETANECSSVFWYVDCSADTFSADDAAKQLDAICKFLKSSKNSRCAAMFMMPYLPPFSDGIESLSERELDYYLNHVCEMTPALEQYLKLYNQCKEAVQKDGIELTLLRYNNLFSAERFSTPSFPLEKTICDSIASKEVKITDADSEVVSGITPIQAACKDAVAALLLGKPGHVYNGSSVRTDLASLKEMIASSVPGYFTLTKITKDKPCQSFNALNCLKIVKACRLGAIQPDVLPDAIKHSVCQLSGCEFDTSSNIAFYDGKLRRLQELEVYILGEIDRICRENDIQYFLAGGTLLGAVRNGSFIPWDDDLDIGMLRDDYEKFRKICEKNLGPDFVFSSPYNKSGSHYTLEKVRLRGTYVSTGYSIRHPIHDGIFVDVLVYDKTSNNRVLRHMHTRMVMILCDLVTIRWRNGPIGGPHRRLAKAILPFVKIFPYGFYHHLFDFTAKFYRHKKDSKYLIDTVGKKLRDDPLPNIGLDKVKYVDFEGMKAPIPADPAPYLISDYGTEYMTLPMPSMRIGPHAFHRVDFGGFLFGNEENCRKINLRGELYEAADKKKKAKE